MVWLKFLTLATIEILCPLLLYICWNKVKLRLLGMSRCQHPMPSPSKRPPSKMLLSNPSWKKQVFIWCGPDSDLGKVNSIKFCNLCETVQPILCKTFKTVQRNCSLIQLLSSHALDSGSQNKYKPISSRRHKQRSHRVRYVERKCIQAKLAPSVVQSGFSKHATTLGPCLATFELGMWWYCDLLWSGWDIPSLDLHVRTAQTIKTSRRGCISSILLP